MVKSCAWVLAALSMTASSWAWAHGAFHELIALANSRVEKEPDNPEVFIHRGELFRAHGDFDQALADFGRAGRLLPKDGRLDLLKGRTLTDAGRLLAAKSHLDRYVARHPESAPGLVERARVLSLLGDHRSAARDYRQAIGRLPAPSPEDFVNAANAYRAAGQPERALKMLDEGSGRLGPMVSLLQPAIELELASRRWNRALERLELLAAQAPRKERYLHRRGEILVMAGRLQDARKAFEAALDAIASLPPHLRGVPATTELEQSTRAALEDLPLVSKRPSARASRK
jgi:tetratricopeptide (TPR) repeat protein